MSAREVVKQNLRDIKITDAQIDPFGYCNAKCWFCPVRYEKNPSATAKHMPVDLVDKVFSEIKKEQTTKDGVVAAEFWHFYTAHYNEVLLYKYLDEMLFLAEYYNYKTMVLSNGSNLTEEKLQVLSKRREAIASINLNIPAFEEELWKERSGITRHGFDVIEKNVKNTMKMFPDMVENGSLSIGINIPAESITKQQNPDVVLMERAPKLREREADEQLSRAKSMFPKLNIYLVDFLVDRAGILEDFSVLSNKNMVNKIKQNNRNVVGCSNGNNGRVYGWLHVNSIGDTFLCCNDYNFDYVFGNLATQNLKDIWLGDRHEEMILSAYKEICAKCVSAVWGDQ